MGPRGEDPVREAILRPIAVSPESELEMVKMEKSRLSAAIEAGEKLVTDFLEADKKNDFKALEAMKDEIANLVKPEFLKLVDDFVDGDTYKNSEDPKAMAGALLDLVTSVGGHCNGSGFDVVNGEDDKAANL